MLLLSIALIAAAQETPTPAEPAAPVRDPNKITCQSRLRTGSRTNFIQVCHTQAEWDQIRSENRRVVERGQANRGLKGE